MRTPYSQFACSQAWISVLLPRCIPPTSMHYAYMSYDRGTKKSTQCATRGLVTTYLLVQLGHDACIDAYPGHHTVGLATPAAAQKVASAQQRAQEVRRR